LIHPSTIFPTSSENSPSNVILLSFSLQGWGAGLSWALQLPSMWYLYLQRCKLTFILITAPRVILQEQWLANKERSGPNPTHHLFLFSPQAKNSLYIFKWLKK
jgi:hypothetical protein